MSKWFQDHSLRIKTYGEHLYEYCYHTPLANAYYEPHGKSVMEEATEPYNLKYAGQVVQHLKAREYAIDWAIWCQCKTLVKSNLAKVVKIWGTIEEKLLSSIPTGLTEWDAKGASPSSWYILDNTVWEIYREAESFLKTGKLPEDTLFRKRKEKDYFEVGAATLYARSSDEALVDEFTRVVLSIVTNKDLLTQIEWCDAEKKKMDELLEHFKEFLNRIEDDFENGHINLKGTCKRCKDWHDELAHLI